MKVGILNEAFKTRDLEKVLDIIEKYLTKKVGVVSQLFNIERFRQNYLTEYYGVRFMVPGGHLFRLNWLTDPNSSSSRIESVDFWFTRSPLPTFKLRADQLNIIQILAGIELIIKNKTIKISSHEYIEKFIEADIFDQTGKLLEGVETLYENKELSEDEITELNSLKHKMVRREQKKSASWENKTRFVYLRIKEMGFGDVADKVFDFDSVETEENIDSEEARLIREMEQRLSIKITPAQKFEDLKINITRVAQGIDNSLIITGTPGVGKTYTVTKTINDYGYRPRIDWELINGKTSPFGLYQTLYFFRDDKILVFDDCDSVFDGVGVDILKGALDTGTVRRVSWKSPKTFNPTGLTQSEIDKLVEKGKVPDTFELTSTVIFITNISKDALLGNVRLAALMSRSLLLDMTFTKEEILERIKEVIPHMDIFGVPMEDKLEAFDILVLASKMSSFNRPLDFRTYISIAKTKVGLEMYKMKSAELGETYEYDANTIIEQVLRQA